MEENRPVLSICIPTYNRAAVLEKTLDTIVQQLDDEIEIVISDNCSTDNTEEVGRKYANKYKNIKYFRNEVNVRDANFSLSLDRGTGLYLKLMKDSLEIINGGLQYLKQIILQYKEARIPLFFTNGKFMSGKTRDVYRCDSFDDFIIHASYLVTGITFFGCWREQWLLIKNRDKYSKLQLSQDDWIYQLLAIKGKAVLCTKKYFFLYEVGKRSGYNWFGVHVTNYYNIMKPYVDSEIISKYAVKKEKCAYSTALKPQLTYAYIYKYMPSWDFDLTGKNKILWSHFKNVPKYYFVMTMLPFTGVWIILKNKGRDFLIKHNIWDRIKQNKFIRMFS